MIREFLGLLRAGGVAFHCSGLEWQTEVVVFILGLFAGDYSTFNRSTNGFAGLRYYPLQSSLNFNTGLSSGSPPKFFKDLRSGRPTQPAVTGWPVWTDAMSDGRTLTRVSSLIRYVLDPGYSHPICGYPFVGRSCFPSARKFGIPQPGLHRP
jgi:hypothetical protein